jgi:tryptophan halogenase
MPPMLDHKVRLFQARGHLVRYEWETFLDPSWLAIYHGFGVLPRSYDPLADRMEVMVLERAFAEMRASIGQAVEAAPEHGEFLASMLGSA